MSRCFLLISLSLFASIGCSSASTTLVPIGKCNVGGTCAVQGTLVASHGMGSIRDQDDCVAVALPEFVPDTWNLKTVEAWGTIYKAPDYPGLVTYKLNGRDVDAEACYSGLTMFVDHIEPIPGKRK